MVEGWREQPVDAPVTDPIAEQKPEQEPQTEAIAAEADSDVVLALRRLGGDGTVAAGLCGPDLDREGMRRLAADELGLPTAPFWFAGSVSELRAVAEHAGYPLRVKPVRAAGTDAESLMVRADDVEPAWRRAGAGRVLAETPVQIDDVVTLLTVRGAGPDGPTLDFCAPIGHRRLPDDGTCGTLECWQPQPMSAVALDAARSIAARIVTALDGRGVFGVELMIHGDEVYFVDVTVCPSDIGLLTQRSQRLSAAELHARAVLGLPLDTIMISPGAARLVEIADVGVGALAGALAVPETDVVVRGAVTAVLATGTDVATAREHAERASAALRADASDVPD